MRTYVIFLEHMHYEKEVADDGGLSVLALTPREAQENIWRGAIVAAQAGLVSWSFYEEVIKAREQADVYHALYGVGYLQRYTARVSK